MRLGVINGLRGIAILGVFLIHSFGDNISYKQSIAGQIAGTGWYGVYLFFMLSGFVLYLPFADGSKINLVEFYSARAKRLYPLMLIAAFVCIAIYGGKPSSDPEFWKMLFKIPTTLFFFDVGGIPGNGAFWSLAVEIYLSLALPILVYVMRRVAPWQFALSMVLAATAFKIAKSTGWISPPAGHGQYIMLLDLVVQALSDFLLGMAVAHYWKAGKIERFFRYPVITFAVAAVVILLLLISINDVRSSNMAFGWRVFVWPTCDLLLAVMIATALTMRGGPIEFVLTSAPLQLIGMMCYSIYVWHMPLLGKIGNGSRVELEMAWYTLTNFAAIFVFSVLSYRFIEFPGRSLEQLFLWPRQSRERTELYQRTHAAPQKAGSRSHAPSCAACRAQCR